jgi:hypothetical protein
MRWVSEQRGAEARQDNAGRMYIEVDLEDGTLDLQLARIGDGRHLGQCGHDPGDFIDIIGVEPIAGQPALRATWRRVWLFDDRIGPATQWVLWQVVGSVQA